MIKRVFQQIIRKQLYILPSRNFTAMLPGQKIMNDWNYDQRTFTELPSAIAACHTTKMLANLLKENLDKLSDKHIAQSIFHIAKYDLELEDEFYDIIIPIVKEFLKNMDREHNKSFGKIVVNLGYLKVKNRELWEQIEHKLLEENLIRYLYLEDVIGVSFAFKQVGVLNKTIFEKLENQLVQHRLALTDQQRKKVTKVFKDAKLGSNVLFKVMEDPQVDLIQLMKLENKTKELN